MDVIGFCLVRMGMKIQVYCSKCGEWIDEKKVKATNIEENIYGEDVLTFICPNCNTEQKSRRIGRR